MCIRDRFFPSARQIVYCNFSQAVKEHFDKAKVEDSGLMVLATDEVNVLGYILAGGFGKGVKEREVKFGTSMEMRLVKEGPKYSVVIVLNGEKIDEMAYAEFIKKIEGDKDCWKKVC
eukprot:TRINITY_DN17727_c0_g1_i1.p2 TRINITY_DN17727_c0_g1~~TRINITY_DN17727_c0_g1_i1.p2  ORF type:complete len:117 (+),score=50.80 TRINITY_DN17727_c0_g1_i1:63-413(+)